MLITNFKLFDLSLSIVGPSREPSPSKGRGLCPLSLRERVGERENFTETINANY